MEASTIKRFESRVDTIKEELDSLYPKMDAVLSDVLIEQDEVRRLKELLLQE